MKKLISLLIAGAISFTCFTISAQTKPHFVGITAGASLPLASYQAQTIEDGCFTTLGVNFCGEGAWFITKKLGFGVHLSWNQHPVNVSALGAARIQANPFLADTYIRSDPWIVKSAMAGAFFQQSFKKKFAFTANLLVGISEARTPYQVHEPQYFLVSVPYEIITESIDRSTTWMLGFGIRYELTPCYALVWENNFFSNPFAFIFETSDGYRTDHKKITFLNSNIGIRFNLSRN
jgi:hypothetical protein